MVNVRTYLEAETDPQPVIIDGNSLVVRSIMSSALDDLKAGGIWTGGLYGAVSSLASLLSFLETGSTPARGVYMFFDCGAHPLRKQLLPDYKSDRRKKAELLSPEEKAKAFAQLEESHTMFTQLGVRVLRFQDREADDGVAAAAMLFAEAGYEPIVVSGDRDLFQCVQFGAKVWYLNTKEWVTRDNFRDAVKTIFKVDDGVSPELYTLFRALCGDTSDGIAGVPGVGPKRAAELLLDVDHEIDVASHGAYSLGDDLPDVQLSNVVKSIAEIVAAAPKGTPAFKRAVVDNHEYLRRVLQVVDLRGSFGPTGTLVSALQNVPIFDRNAARKYFLRLKFKSVIGDEHRYFDPFERAAQRRDSA